MYVVKNNMRQNAGSEFVDALSSATSYASYDDAKTAAGLLADIVGRTISRVKYNMENGALRPKVTVERILGKFVVGDDAETVAEFSVKPQGVNL